MPTLMNHMPPKNYYQQHLHYGIIQRLAAALPENSNFGAQFKFYCKTPNFVERPHYMTTSFPVTIQPEKRITDQATRQYHPPTKPKDFHTVINDKSTILQGRTIRRIFPTVPFCVRHLCCFVQKFFYFRTYTLGQHRVISC